MNIDWSKAPEDATHAGNSPYEKGVITWFKGISDPASRNYFMNEGSMNAWAISSENLSAWHLIERPKKQYAWGGEGLPPVGMDIECTFDSWGYWRKGRVLYYGKQMIFMEQYGESPDGRKFEGSMNPDGIKFRPVRTAEQVAAEEREKAIEEMVFGVCGCEPGGGNTSAFMVCGFLYDAGYRKQ